LAIVLFEGGEVGGGGAKVGYAKTGEKVGDGEGAMGLEGASLEEDDGCGGCKTGDQPMPHHPGTCCNVEESILGMDIALEDVFFFVLNESTGCRVYDAFRLSCRA